MFSPNANFLAIFLELLGRPGRAQQQQREKSARQRLPGHRPSAEGLQGLVVGDDERAVPDDGRVAAQRDRAEVQLHRAGDVAAEEPRSVVDVERVLRPDTEGDRQRAGIGLDVEPHRHPSRPPPLNDQGNPAAAKDLRYQIAPDPPLGLTALFAVVLFEQRAPLPIQRDSNLLGETPVPNCLETMFMEALANFTSNCQRPCFIGFRINA